MKKRKNAETINGFGGLAHFTRSSNGDVLTLEKFEKFVDYVTSDEYAEQEHERMRFRAMGEIIAGRALEMKLITLEEYLRLLVGININGGLIVGKQLYDKILPAAEAVERDMGANG